ncbi:MAG TPA: hypothetical protein VGQ26_17865 [Streptosporangiaceae bacterium]|nr:hypothetical protein [Streptosporangiaceae bacterium]
MRWQAAGQVQVEGAEGGDADHESELVDRHDDAGCVGRVRLRAEHDVASQATYLKIFRHLAHERLAMTTTSLAVLAVPGTRVVVYTPADEVTRQAVAGLLRGEGADARFPCWDSHQRQRSELERAGYPAR